MCGFAGFIRDGVAADQDLLSKMLYSIRYRGPDDQSELVEDNLALGHRRLKVIDLSDHANQPMSDESKRCHLAFNGEIYNFKKLRKELVSLGHHFKTNSDTEVLLHSYLQWGEASFLKLNGMFAFSIYDKRGPRPKLYLVRDRSGIKPLFYTIHQKEIGFASEIKPLLKLPWVKRDVSKENLFLFLKHGHIPTPKSIFEGISQLEQGEFLLFQEGLSTKKKYWNSRELTKRDSFLRPDQALKELDQAFRDVTERQVVSDVPIGCFLSGGIDSSLLVSYFSEISSKKIKTFSIGYKEAEFDESYYARIVADQFKTDHHEIIVSPKDLFNLIQDIPTFYDQPFSDPTLMPTMLLCQFTRNHVTVALSGDGGDELFFGYLYHEMLYKLDPLQKVPRFIRMIGFELIRFLLGPVQMKLPLKAQQIRKFCEILQFKNTAEFFQYFIGTIGPLRMDRIASLIKDYQLPIDSYYDQYVRVMDSLNRHEKIEQIFFKTFLIDTVLQKTDRASMAYSLEVRVPFLDHQMLEVSSRIPFSLKYKNGVKKSVLRELLKTKLPSEIVDRPKQGFSIPLREWLRGDLNYLVKEFLNSKRLSQSEYLSEVQVKRLIDEHMSGFANHSHLIWSMICFEMWRETYLKSPA